GILREYIEDELREPTLHCARLGDQRKVRRSRTVVCRSSRSRVRVWRREVVGRKRLAGEHFAIRVRAVLHFIFSGKRLDLFRRVTEAFQRAEGDQVHRMAGRADFLVDLQAALQLALVIGSERTGEAPLFLLGMVDRKMFRLRGITAFLSRGTTHRTGEGDTKRDQRNNTEGSEILEDVFHCYVLHLSRWFSPEFLQGFPLG